MSDSGTPSPAQMSPKVAGPDTDAPPRPTAAANCSNFFSIMFLSIANFLFAKLAYSLFPVNRENEIYTF